VISYIV